MSPPARAPARTGRRRLYLMRHGHVDYFAPGITDFRQVPLTEEGQAQAEAAGRLLAKVSFDRVFTSGLPRSEQTAARVLAGNESAGEVPVTAVADLEELKGGSVVVDTREALAAILAFSFDDAATEGATFLPGGEAFADARRRMVRGLQSLLTQHDWRQALLVAHDGTNRILLAEACGAGLEGIRHFEQDLACINVLDFDVVASGDGGVEVVRSVLKAINVTAYDVAKNDLMKTSLEHLFDIDFGGARPPRRNC